MKTHLVNVYLRLKHMNKTSISASVNICKLKPHLLRPQCCITNLSQLSPATGEINLQNGEIKLN